MADPYFANEPEEEAGRPPPYKQTFSLPKKSIPRVKISDTSDSPSSRESGYVASKWGIGWRTPLLMMVFYTLALLLALGHLGLFLYLKGRPADGQNRAAPQSYVSTASVILSNAFGMSLKASLAIAFTQYLWYTLRVSTMKISTIDSLFSIRDNVFLLFDPRVVVGGPELVIIAAIIWSVQIVASFPPGALTIDTSIKISNGSTDIPIFNASFFGNTSGFDAERISFYGFLCDNCTGQLNSSVPLNPEMEVYPQLFGIGLNPLAALTPSTLMNGIPSTMTSPCGANCSFTIVLDVPYLNCNTTIFNLTIEDTTGPSVYNAIWFEYVLNITTYFVDFSGVGTDIDSTSQSNFPAQGTTTLCTPARANYTLNFGYENNIQTLNTSIGAVTPLQRSAPPTSSSPFTEAAEPVNFPGFMGKDRNGGGFYYGQGPLNWTEPLISWYRDLQLVAFIDGMANSLAGSVLIDFLKGAQGEIPANGTVVPNTRFHKSFGTFLQDEPSLINNLSLPGQRLPTVANPYNVTQELLNQALLNITLSVMADLRWWPAVKTPVTQWRSINIYVFSKPLNLIIPYFVSLLVTIPVLGLGVYALRQNGVSAVDGGFLQLMTTTTGSATLEKLAAGGCLGGNESVPKELKELKVRFGELIGEGMVGGAVRRAGFGTVEEIVPMNKGAVYGSGNSFTQSYI